MTTEQPSAYRHLKRSKVKKVCSPFCPTNTDKSSMIAKDIQHQGTVFKDLDSPFSINEFNLALSQSRKNSSPGLDQTAILCFLLCRLNTKNFY